MSEEGEEQKIEIPYQPYIVADEEGLEIDDGVFWVLRLDLDAKDPQEGVAARQAMMTYATTLNDRQKARGVIDMLGKILKLEPDKVEDIWKQCEDKHNGKPVQIPMPRKKIRRL